LASTLYLKFSGSIRIIDKIGYAVLGQSLEIPNFAENTFVYRKAAVKPRRSGAGISGERSDDSIRH